MKNNSILFLMIILLSACSKERRSDKAGTKMQEFVINISNYAREFDSDFIVVPQNGAELAFDELSPDNGLNSAYMAAIDGIGIEELFYNGDLFPEDERLSMLQTLTASKKIMVSEYVTDDLNIQDAIQRNTQEGFICFPRTNLNYDYTQIPDSVINENNNNILSIEDAQNYLYMISTDNYSTKQEMIDSIAATNFDVILIDLFFEDDALSTTEVEQLKTKANGGQRLVISYMNIGAAESYRYYWNPKWKLHRPCWLKKPYDGYVDEIWVKFWKKEWQEIIYGNDNSYTKKIINAGFDGVYLDNVEAYYFLYFD